MDDKDARTAYVRDKATIIRQIVNHLLYNFLQWKIKGEIRKDVHAADCMQPLCVMHYKSSFNLLIMHCNAPYMHYMFLKIIIITFIIHYNTNLFTVTPIESIMH